MLLRRYKKRTVRTKKQLDILKKGKDIIPPRVLYYSKLMGLDYNKIYIRLQKTRWGSCSTKKNLNFNFNALLVLMPEEILDSVIVHELSHLKYMNHQKEFWNLVYKFYNEEKYKKSRKYLNNEGRELVKKYLYN